MFSTITGISYTATRATVEQLEQLKSNKRVNTEDLQHQQNNLRETQKITELQLQST